MNELTLANRAADWHRLKALVLDSVSSPITRRVYNLGLDEFIAWFGQAPRPGFTKATVNSCRAEIEARGLGAVSINVRITAVRKLAVEAADNGLLASDASLFEIVADFERRVIIERLEQCSWSQTEAAADLNVPLSTLNQKIKRLNIEVKRRRAGEGAEQG